MELAGDVLRNLVVGARAVLREEDDDDGEACTERVLLLLPVPVLGPLPLPLPLPMRLDFRPRCLPIGEALLSDTGCTGADADAPAPASVLATGFRDDDLLLERAPEVAAAGPAVATASAAAAAPTGCFLTTSTGLRCLRLSE